MPVVDTVSFLHRTLFFFLPIGWSWAPPWGDPERRKVVCLRGDTRNHWHYLRKWHRKGRKSIQSVLMSRLSWWATGAQCHWGHKEDRETNLQVFPPRGNLRSPPSLIDSRRQEHQEHQFLGTFQSAPRESQASSCEIPQRKGIPDKSLQKKKRETNAYYRKLSVCTRNSR